MGEQIIIQHCNMMLKFCDSIDSGRVLNEYEARLYMKLCDNQSEFVDRFYRKDEEDDGDNDQTLGVDP